MDKEWPESERRKYPCGHCQDHPYHVKKVDEIYDWIKIHSGDATSMANDVKDRLDERVKFTLFWKVVAGFGCILSLILYQQFALKDTFNDLKIAVNKAITENNATVRILSSELRHISKDMERIDDDARAKKHDPG